MSHSQNGGHDAISHRGGVPPDELKQSICHAHVQQRMPVPDLLHIHTCLLNFFEED